MWLDCLASTVFSPENVSVNGSDIPCDAVMNTHEPPVQTLHMSYLDSSTDEESVDHTESRYLACKTLHQNPLLWQPSLTQILLALETVSVKLSMLF